MAELSIEIFDEPLKEAERAFEEDEVPVGAIIVKDGKIIARAHNQREQDQDPLAHAEIRAIQAAALALGEWRLLGCELVVTLEPCPMCLAACQQARFSRVVYGAKDPKGGALSLGYKLHEDQRINHRFEVDYVEDPRCGEILSRFFSEKRKSR
jgi:tRNA(adenine34) deaminase